MPDDPDFTEEAVIYDKEYASDRPGERITESDRIDVGSCRHSQHDPEDTNQADTTQADQGRDPAVSYAAQGAGEHFHTHISDKSRYQEVDDLYANLQHIGIRGEETVNDMPSEAQQDTDHYGGRKAHAQTAPDTFVDTIHLPGAVILAREGCDGDAEGTDGHPEEGVHLPVYGPGSDGICPETVDGSLDDDIGETVHDGLQAGRKSDPDNAVQHSAVDTDPVQVKPVHVLYTHQYQNHKHGAQSLGADGGDSGACHTQIETYDQEQIQQDIREAAGDQEVERTSGIPDCPQNAGAYVIDQIANGSCIINTDIENGRIKHIFRGIHCGEDGRSSEDADGHQHKSADYAESHGRMYRIVHQF